MAKWPNFYSRDEFIRCLIAMGYRSYGCGENSVVWAKTPRTETGEPDIEKAMSFIQFFTGCTPTYPARPALKNRVLLERCDESIRQIEFLGA